MIKTQMRFGEYIKQLGKCEFGGKIIISHKDIYQVYGGESDFNNMFVSWDFKTPTCIYVSLSDEPKDSEIVVLESLHLRYEQELKRKEKAKKDLEEYNKMWDEHEKERWLELIICAVGFLLAIGVAWLFF